VPKYQIPYGKSHLTFSIPENFRVDVIAPPRIEAADNPRSLVEMALDHPVGEFSLEDFIGVRSAAIAINDKTRPVPNQYLLPPLLQRLENVGLTPESITLLIATGTHPPMQTNEFTQVVPVQVLKRYRVICHTSEDKAQLLYLGKTNRGTPILINRHYAQAELRLAVGNIGPHQFQGFSGGVKPAAIGLAGRATIDHNHAMMSEPESRLGNFENNPARQDVEEIGQRIGVHMALNAILNDNKDMVAVFAGEPLAVMHAGIPVARRYCQVPVETQYDFVIASVGGHPKDINLYQSQKGLAHACMVTRPGGTLILAAACPEGTGSKSYETWMAQGASSYQEVIERFKQEDFRVGPHKAYQIARDASRVRLRFLSRLDEDLATRLLLNPVDDLQNTIDQTLAGLNPQARIGVILRASSTVPYIDATG
jgi:nickel-dependent lactate racemase